MLQSFFCNNVTVRHMRHFNKSIASDFLFDANTKEQGNSKEATIMNQRNQFGTNERIHKCLVCKKIGRLARFPDYNAHLNEIPILRCHGRTYDCCNKYIWAHENNQPNDTHKFNCESKIKKTRNDAFKERRCVICNKRSYYNKFEKSALLLLTIGGFHIVGKVASNDAALIKSIIIGAGISASVVLFLGVCVGGYLFANYRNSDVVDEE